MGLGRSQVIENQARKLDFVVMIDVTYTTVGEKTISYDPDKERLRRLKQKQVAARDPGESKIKGYDWSKHDKKARRVAAEKRKQAQRPLVVQIWEVLPGRWRGAVYGVVFGLLLDIPLLLFLPAEWRVLLLVPLLLCGVVGMIVGRTMQSDYKL